MMMLIQSTKLFLKGKLFRDNSKVIRQLLIGIVVGVGSMLFTFQVLDQSFLVSCIVGGIISGSIQPLLFKDLKAH